MDHNFTALVEPRVTPLVNAIFLKYSSGESTGYIEYKFG